ncbi:MAG: hypothetical protein AAF438_20190, partial [Pseudomonadota bacterium]
MDDRIAVVPNFFKEAISHRERVYPRDYFAEVVGIGKMATWDRMSAPISGTRHQIKATYLVGVVVATMVVFLQHFIPREQDSDLRSQAFHIFAVRDVAGIILGLVGLQRIFFTLHLWGAGAFSLDFEPSFILLHASRHNFL